MLTHRTNLIDYAGMLWRNVLCVLCATACFSVDPPQPIEIPSLHITGGAKTDTVCFYLDWKTCPIWEVTDDQALHDGSLGYGPMAHIIPSPELATLTSVGAWTAKGTGGVLAALVIIDTTDAGMRPITRRTAGAAGPLPSTYQALRLEKGHNCLYIAHANGPEDAGWTAFVVPVAPGPAPCPADRVGGSPVNVTTFQHPSFTEAAHYPPVARFHEGQRGAVKWVPQMGLKCANRWCVVSGNSTFLTPPHVAAVPGGGPDVQRPWLVPGWHDVQHIGDAPATAGGAPLPRFGVAGFRAAFIPDPALESYTDVTFRAGPWIHVGTIWLSDPPPVMSKYHTLWKLKPGSNEMYLRMDAAGKWEGILLAGGDEVPLMVEQELHNDFPIPGVVRFRWSFNDEEGWVRCDVGCCKVGPGSGGFGN